MWGPAVSQRGETLPQGSQTMTGTCWDPCLKGNCLPGYLQKKNGSDPSYIMSLTSYYLNQRKCIIQRGESSLFTLSIYSLCCDFFLVEAEGLSVLLKLCCFAVRRASVSVLGMEKAAWEGANFPFSTAAICVPALVYLSQASASPWAFCWVIQLPKSTPWGRPKPCV